jgi:hypothetical protein
MIILEKEKKMNITCITIENPAVFTPINLRKAGILKIQLLMTTSTQTK